MGDDCARRARRAAALLAIGGLAVGLTRASAAHAPAARGATAGLSASERGLVVSVNRLRAARGLPAFAASASLAAAARAHAVSMSRQGYFSHDSADGTPAGKRIAAYYPAAGYASWQVGEALYWSTSAASPGAVAAAWLASAEHRLILLGPWAQLGVAIVRTDRAPGVYGGHSVLIAVADFGLRRR